MNFKKAPLLFCPALLLAAQATAPLAAAEAVGFSESKAEAGSASDSEAEMITGIQVIDGKFFYYSPDGVCDETKSQELQEAAQKEKDISGLLELIGEPEETEYYGQGCWFGESGKESGEDGAWYYDHFVIYVYQTEDLTYYMGAQTWVEEAELLEPETEATGFQDTASGQTGSQSLTANESDESNSQNTIADKSNFQDSSVEDSDSQNAAADGAGSQNTAVDESDPQSLDADNSDFRNSVSDNSDLRSMVAEAVEKNANAASPSLALLNLFRYVEKTYSYARTIGFENYNGWPEEYAREMLTDEAGSCYHFAALYGYLAKEATGYDVRICIGSTDGFESGSWQKHAWTEIKIDDKWYVFDPNLDKYGADESLKYYKLDTEFELYDATYQTEETCELTFEVKTQETDADAESESETDVDAKSAPETESEAAARAHSEAENETASGIETDSETMPEADSETETESGTSSDSILETDVDSETESESETAVKSKAETESPAQMTDKIEITEEGECVLTLDNRSELAFTEATLAADGQLTLTDADGSQHQFLEVDKNDIGTPYLLMYGSFLSIKYTSASTGKAARLVEEGDDITFEQPQTMTITTTVYVRSAADLNADKLSVADKGTPVSVIGETGKWYKVALKDGREGYISKVGIIVDHLPAASSQGTSQEAPGTEPETETEPEPETVIVERNGKYYRYERFTPAEDTIVKIKNTFCYVTAGGEIASGWKVLNGQLYYAEADGTLKCSGTRDGITFGEDGTAVADTNSQLKIRTMEIVRSITDDTMSQSQKLSACWRYVTNGHLGYAGKYPDLNAAGWQRALALDALTSGSGNCYGFACAFAALAEEVGYDPVVVCGRVSGSRDRAADGMTRHSWVMINGCHYDPEAQWAGWCGGIYGYGSYPVTHSVQRTVEF